MIKINLKSRVNIWVSEQTARDRRVFREALDRDAQQKERNQQSGTGERFQVGDLVLIPKVNRLKTEPRRQGPYEVVQVRDGGVYRLKDMTNFRKPRILRNHRQLTKYEAREGEVWGHGETLPTVQQNPGEGPAVKPRGRPRKETEPTPGPRMPQMRGEPKGPAQIRTSDEEAVGTSGTEREEVSEEMEEHIDDQASKRLGVREAEQEERDREENMQVDLDEQMQPLDQGGDEDAAREEHRDRRKFDARERRGEAEEEPRRSKRPNKGVPPVKYLMDLIGKWVALRSKTEARVQNWARSHLPWKREAVMRVAPFYLGGRSVGHDGK